MRSPLFIFNFKNLPTACLMAVAMIVVIETSLKDVLPQKYFSHMVDKYLYKIDHQHLNGKVVVLGDSVGQGCIPAEFEKKDHKGFVSMISVYPVEMTGNYFLLKRYLQKNINPDFVIYVGKNPLGQNLERPETENFFQRCFIK